MHAVELDPVRQQRDLVVQGRHPPERAELRVGRQDADGVFPVVVIAGRDPEMKAGELLEALVGMFELLLELANDFLVARVGVGPDRHLDPVLVEDITEDQT